MISERDACIVFNMISGVGFVKFNALSTHFGSPSAALEASADELMMVRGVGEQLSLRIANWRESVDLESELKMANLGGVDIFTLYDDNYPSVLRELPDPPICLYVKGRLPDFDSVDMIAIVGSRRASSYGRRIARDLAEQAVFAKWGVVSGLAYGIDFEGHDATVRVNGLTVAVLGGGLAKVQPQDHIPLAREIVRCGGAVISEFPMNFPVSRTSFPRRNRIIAGLSRGIIVVEAGVDSGAMLTANLGLDYGKSIFAVPGSIGNPQAAGCHFLIKRGEAKLIESFGDVLEEFNPEFEQGSFEFADAKADYQPTSQLNLPADEQTIVDFLREHGESSYDAISLALDLPPGRLSSKLAVLEMKLIVLQNPGRRYILR